MLNNVTLILSRILYLILNIDFVSIEQKLNYHCITHSPAQSQTLMEWVLIRPAPYPLQRHRKFCFSHWSKMGQAHKSLPDAYSNFANVRT